jgi:hypothetical protein
MTRFVAGGRGTPGTGRWTPLGRSSWCQRNGSAEVHRAAARRAKACCASDFTSTGRATHDCRRSISPAAQAQAVSRDHSPENNLRSNSQVSDGLSSTRKLSRNGAVGRLSSTLALRCGLFIQFRRPERLPRFHGAGICGPSSSSCCSFLSSPTRSCRHWPTKSFVGAD